MDLATPALESTRLVLFRAGSGPLKALPLSLVSRIESVANDRLTQSDGMLIMMHQGSLVPVLAASPDVVRTKATHPILVISIGEDFMGLLVDEIVDVIEEPLDIQIAGTADDVVDTAENLRRCGRRARTCEESAEIAPPSGAGAADPCLLPARRVDPADPRHESDFRLRRTPPKRRTGASQHGGPEE